MNKSARYKVLITTLLTAGAVGAGISVASVATAAEKPVPAVAERLANLRGAAIEAKALMPDAVIDDGFSDFSDAFNQKGTTQPS